MRKVSSEGAPWCRDHKTAVTSLVPALEEAVPHDPHGSLTGERPHLPAVRTAAKACDASAPRSTQRGTGTSPADSALHVHLTGEKGVFKSLPSK